MGALHIVKDIVKDALSPFRRQDLVEEVDAALPSILGETGALIRSGLTFEQALDAASSSGESALHLRLREALGKVSASSSLEEQLSSLSEEIGSEQLRRVIGLLAPAVRGGTASASLLDDLREDLDERASLRREFMTGIRGTVAFIRLSVLCLMPVLLALSLRFIDALAAFRGEGDIGGGVALAGLAPGGVPEAGAVGALSLLMVGGTALFAAVLEGVIRRGSWLAGLRKAPLYIASAEMVFFIAQKFLVTLLL